MLANLGDERCENGMGNMPWFVCYKSLERLSSWPGFRKSSFLIRLMQCIRDKWWKALWARSEWKSSGIDRFFFCSLWSTVLLLCLLGIIALFYYSLYENLVLFLFGELRCYRLGRMNYKSKTKSLINKSMWRFKTVLTVFFGARESANWEPRPQIYIYYIAVTSSYLSCKTNGVHFILPNIV